MQHSYSASRINTIKLTVVALDRKGATVIAPATPKFLPVGKLPKIFLSEKLSSKSVKCDVRQKTHYFGKIHEQI